jgi:hypothetical protein
MQKGRLCPPVSDVFWDNHQLYAQHFKPLLSIDLAKIDSNLTGEIFIVYFNNDPYCAGSVKTYNAYCNAGKVTFDIIEGKYVFRGDFDFFVTNEDWLEWLRMGDASYKEFIKSIAIEKLTPSDFIEFRKKPRWIQADETPLNSKGKKMKFICQVNSGSFISDYCEEEIYLFYDPFDKVAVQVHQID